MQSKTLSLLLVTCLAFLTIGCSSEMAEPNDSRLGFTFFPLEGGLFKVYEVEKIDYKVTGEIDTAKYFLKEAVVDSFLNETNSFTYILHRSIRSKDQEWKLDSVWTAKKTSHQAIAIENNIPFVKLVFPFKERAAWDGNSLNTHEMEEYVMENVNHSITLNNQTFDKSVTIIHKDNEDSIIFLEKRKEIYAQDIGLIYKESAAIKYCAQAHCIGKNQIDMGVLFKQTILESGKD